MLMIALSKQNMTTTACLALMQPGPACSALKQAGWSFE
jgi:hypothetical protein